MRSNLFRWSALASFGLMFLLFTGCGGNTDLEEGVPEDAAQKSDDAYEEFKAMQQGMGDAMQKAKADPAKEK